MMKIGARRIGTPLSATARPSAAPLSAGLRAAIAWTAAAIVSATQGSYVLDRVDAEREREQRRLNKSVRARRGSQPLGGPDREPHGQGQRRLHLEIEETDVRALFAGYKRWRECGDHHARRIFDDEIAPWNERPRRRRDPAGIRPALVAHSRAGWTDKVGGVRAGRALPRRRRNIDGRRSRPTACPSAARPRSDAGAAFARGRRGATPRATG